MKDSNQYDDLNVWLMKELTRIVNEANGKKRELWNILTQSPYITFREYIYFGIIWHNFRAEETIHASKPWWATLHWSTKYLVWFIAFPCILLAAVLDFIYWMVMLMPSLPSKSEQHWYENVFDMHPTLCTFGIDDFVKEQMVCCFFRTFLTSKYNRKIFLITINYLTNPRNIFLKKKGHSRSGTQC